MKLSDCIKIKRRYSRSVNLERDIEISDSVSGYVLTPRAIDILAKFDKSFTVSNMNRAWTFTGVYGTGKSAFAHFLTALVSPDNKEIKKNALQVLSEAKSIDKSISANIFLRQPKSGLVRAIATAQHEAIANTIIRALHKGACLFWPNKKPVFFAELQKEYNKIISAKEYRSDNKLALRLISTISKASKTGLLLIIDELGKNLGYSAHSQSLDDLYLLQQIAELPSSKNDAKVFILGILHQSFADYAHGLVKEQKNEWAKIQGRFEDIIFSETPDQQIRIIGNALEHNFEKSDCSSLSKWINGWKLALKDNGAFDSIDKNLIAAVYPLHPVSAVILPILCNKYAQNDRTLFTFLTSPEAYSAVNFLSENHWNPQRPVTLKPYHIYDYFIETAGGTVSLRPEFQRWTEIQNKISEARHQDTDSILVLKTIGVLNLISVSGPLRASRSLVVTALCDLPHDKNEKSRWDSAIENLLKKGILIWRKQADELRIWEGSDFNIEQHVNEQTQQLSAPIASLLNEHYPLTPIIIPRHSFQTGTLRFFEQHFFDQNSDLNNIECEDSSSDGLICYWIGSYNKAKDISFRTKMANKPIVVISSKNTKNLEIACYEYVALKQIERNSPQLRHDGIARREVKQRLSISKNYLDNIINEVFDVANKGVCCIVRGNLRHFKNKRSFNAKLSDICDGAFFKGLNIKNELIVRKNLTMQGILARRTLIAAILGNNGNDKLGLTGHGPECSMFDSLLGKTGAYIYDTISDTGGFSTPKRRGGIYHIWDVIEKFCSSASENQKKISDLWDTLTKPPYGVRKPIIPILLSAVLTKNANSLGIYKNGTFLPLLETGDFDLLEKKPEIFSVKHFNIGGLRTQAFNELEKIFLEPAKAKQSSKKDISLLKVIKPLIQFITTLPDYTINTNSLSPRALAVKKALLETREPDFLIFNELPKACDLAPINAKEAQNKKLVQNFRQRLQNSLVELQSAHDSLLNKCKDLTCEAFDILSDHKNLLCCTLKERSAILVGKCVEPQLKNFILTTANNNIDERTWLESLIMIISDKPTTTWSDEDFIIFDNKLTDLARRFKNLENLQKEISSIRNKDLYARKITLTKPTGEEKHQILWINRKEQEEVGHVVDQLLKDKFINGSKKLRSALLATLADKILE